MLEVEERVNHLDELMAQLIQTVNQTSREMREFKEEMRRTQDRADARSRREMQEFKEEMRQSHDRFEQEMRLADERSRREMQDFKEEMRLAHERAEERSKREMQEFKEEMRQSKRDLDKKWGELSNKLGTMAEDLVAPSVPNILKQVTGCIKIKYSAVRVRKSEPRNQEFDVVAVCDEWVLINETKSRLQKKHLDDFYELMQEIHEFFPEFAGKKFIGAIASLYVDESLVNYGEKLGLIVLGFGEELMDVLNSPGFVPKQF
jgi:myosin heavy subunit